MWTSLARGVMDQILGWVRLNRARRSKAQAEVSPQGFPNNTHKLAGCNSHISETPETHRKSYRNTPISRSLGPLVLSGWIWKASHFPGHAFGRPQLSCTSLLTELSEFRNGSDSESQPWRLYGDLAAKLSEQNPAVFQWNFQHGGPWAASKTQTPVGSSTVMTGPYQGAFRTESGLIRSENCIGRGYWIATIEVGFFLHIP